MRRKQAMYPWPTPDDRPEAEYAPEVRRPSGWDARSYVPVSEEDAARQAVEAARMCREVGLMAEGAGIEPARHFRTVTA